MMSAPARLLALAILVVSHGCSREPGPFHYSVRGSVRLADGPATTGTIIFAAVDPEAARIDSRETDIHSDGGFEIQLPKGDYRVIVLPDPPHDVVKLDPRMQKSIPASYRTKEHTPLQATITGPTEQLEFKIGS